MVLEFYYDLRSQPCRAVYFLLKSANIDYEAHVLDLFNGDHMKPEFLKLNPFHAMPFIKDGDFKLTESVAILRYLTAKFDVAEHWYPRQDVQKQARVDEFLNWHHSGLRKLCVALFITKFRMRLDFGPLAKIPYDEAAVNAARDDVLKAIKTIADYFLKDKAFIIGDEISVADLIAYGELMHMQLVEEESVTDSNKLVDSWMKRVGEKVSAFKDEPMELMTALKNTYVSAKGK